MEAVEVSMAEGEGEATFAEEEGEEEVMRGGIEATGEEGLMARGTETGTPGTEGISGIGTGIEEEDSGGKAGSLRGREMTGETRGATGMTEAGIEEVTETGKETETEGVIETGTETGEATETEIEEGTGTRICSDGTTKWKKKRYLTKFVLPLY